MKRILLAILFLVLGQNILAADIKCPSYEAIQTTVMDMVLGLDRNAEPWTFDENSHFATMGHLNDSGRSWYVIAGSFKGAHNSNEATQMGQDFVPLIMNGLTAAAGSDNPIGFACVYYHTLELPTNLLPLDQKFVVAFTGQVNKHAYKHLIRTLRHQAKGQENAQHTRHFFARIKHYIKNYFAS